jgi:hypothetical protein
MNEQTGFRKVQDKVFCAARHFLILCPLICSLNSAGEGRARVRAQRRLASRIVSADQIRFQFACDGFNFGEFGHNVNAPSGALAASQGMLRKDGAQAKQSLLVEHFTDTAAFMCAADDFTQHG